MQPGVLGTEALFLRAELCRQTDWAPPSHMACVLGWLLRTSVPVGRKVGFCSGAPRAEERMLSAQANAAVASGAAGMTTAPLAHREDVPAG